MRLEQVASALEQLLGQMEGYAAWRSNGMACARVASIRLQRSATVATAGSGWFEISVDGGFGLFRYAEEIEDDEALAIIKTMCGIASSYIRNGGQIVGRGRFFPRLIVEFDGRNYDLKRTLAHDVKSALGLRRLRAPGRNAGSLEI